MSVIRRHARPNSRRRAFQVLELLFVLPVLTLLLVASLGYASILMIRGGLTQAATVGAREAGKGGDIADVVAAVNGVLATYQLAVSDRPGSGTKVIVQDGFGRVAEYGDPNLSCDLSPWVGTNEVCVTLWIDSQAKKTDGTRTALGMFDIFGLHQQPLCLRSSVKREPPGVIAPECDTAIAIACQD